MSINVTVSGNPVRINRGTMVTAYDPSKTEFEKRRLMRLEQVRQQSKDIAENVRNKFRKEKSKCLSEIEKEGEVRLQNWQARKLLELQNQYQEDLDNIGLGHKNATLEEVEEEILNEQEEINERIAEERGRAAAGRLQIEKNADSLRKAVPIQRKKITRDVEDSRSRIITNKSPFKKKKKNQQVFDSDSENKVPKLVGLDDESSNESSEYEEPPLIRKETEVLKACKEQQTSPGEFQVPTRDNVAQTIIHEDPGPPTPKEFPPDTRISERIKRRTKLNPEVDYCDYIQKEYPKVTFCDCCKCPVRHQHGTNFEEITLLDERTDAQQSEIGRVPEKADVSPKPSRVFSGTEPQKPVGRIDSRTESQKYAGRTTMGGPELGVTPETLEEEPKKHIQKSDQLLKGNRNKSLSKTGVAKDKGDVPSKPKITLRSNKVRPTSNGSDPNTQLVQYYDHPNRYSKSYLPKSSHVEKIVDEELVVSPNLMSEEEMHNKMRQRDRDAQIRGQVALEKEKLQREYRNLLKKLPALQKQERICEIGMDKEKYHMSKDRLEELEKRRQNRLDNAYEELFVRPKPVTLPKRKEDRLEPQSLNLANWETDLEPGEDSNKRVRQLNQSLSFLKSQKDRLWKEIESSISKETLNQLTRSSYDDVKTKSSDYTRVRDDVKSKSTDYTRTKRKRSIDGRPVSPSSSEDATIKTKSVRSSGLSTASSPSPRKKAKLKTSRKTLILQNTSTQTTPQVHQQQSVATSPVVPTTAEPCTCRKDILDDLCEIVIKIKEDEKPEVVVNPPFLGNSIKVVTESVGPEAPKKESPHSETSKKESPHPETSKKESLHNGGSWKDQLSQSGSSCATSSTSYLQPPKEFSRSLNSTGKHSKSASSNVSSVSEDKKLDPRLLTYIKRLLNMSRASIDDLTVSTASDVSTPTHSLVETPTNNPLLQLANVMKYFNLDVADLQKELSYKSDVSSKHYNTSESLTVTSSSEREKSVFKSCTEINESDEDANKLKQYANIAANCTKKINNLTAMIEKVRAEKKKMIESSGSSSNELTTTSYKDLPEKNLRDAPDNTDSDLNKLLTIDYSYAEKLKQLSQEEIQKEKKRTEEQPTDAELLARLKRLLQDNKSPAEAKNVAVVTKAKLLQDSRGKPVALTSEKRVVQDSKSGKTIGFESERTTVTFKPTTEIQESPLFLDIPKLPRLEAPSLEKKKKPPPTKALRAIGGNIPHELSTILEAADSQLSAKIESTLNIESPTSTPKSQEKDLKSHSTTTSSDDVSEMETMETMLVSIGMEWAIPTLKKTREALALTSSSSGSGAKESGEVSLREFLSKISSSTSKSSENSSLLSESQGLSLIQTDNRRTSTPIVDHGEKKQGQPIFLTDSDLSSVREHSERAKDSEEKFYEVNETG